jgi:hypothetical protein
MVNIHSDIDQLIFTKTLLLSQSEKCISKVFIDYVIKCNIYYNYIIQNQVTK